MEKINQLIEIAEELELNSYVAQLNVINQKLLDQNCELLLPLVGEFSSGKTTLINAITDNKKLETAIKPTTATIYEIHFGADKCYAEVLLDNNEQYNVDDISSLKNDTLENAILVRVFDTSTRVPSTITLVDTPGLSSQDSRHKRVLVNFLPSADGILLVVDINQQITRSMTDFIKDMELAKRPIFLVITKCDTKAPEEIEEVKRYISKFCTIPLSKTICVSATDDDVDEFYHLLEAIQCEKSNILNAVCTHRIKTIAKEMTSYIDKLLLMADKDEDIEEAIWKIDNEISQISRNIDSIIRFSKNSILEQKSKIVEAFQREAFARLDRIVLENGKNSKSMIDVAINQLTGIYFNKFKDKILSIINKRCQEYNSRCGDDERISIDNIDMSQLQLPKLDFNLNLDAIGHEHDKKLAKAITLATVGMSNLITKTKAPSLLKTVTKGIVNILSISNDNNQFTEVLIDLITEQVMAKPKRQKVIREYINNTLLPNFSDNMDEIAEQTIDDISHEIRNEAESLMSNKKTTLENLLSEKRGKEDEFRKRIETMNSYKTQIEDILKQFNLCKDIT